MERPWVKPEQVKDYTSSAKVLQRSDTQLAFDIARAEKYVIYYTHNQFKTPEYSSRLPPDVTKDVYKRQVHLWEQNIHWPKRSILIKYDMWRYVYERNKNISEVREHS